MTHWLGIFSVSCVGREVMWDLYLLQAAHALINVPSMFPILYSASSRPKILSW